MCVAIQLLWVGVWEGKMMSPLTKHEQKKEKTLMPSLRTRREKKTRRGWHHAKNPLKELLNMHGHIYHTKYLHKLSCSSHFMLGRASLIRTVSRLTSRFVNDSTPRHLLSTFRHQKHKRAALGVTKDLPRGETVIVVAI